MSNITKADVGEVKQPSVRKPDYHYRAEGKVWPGFLNENIDVYDVMLRGEYFCTIFIPYYTPDDEAREKVLLRARTLSPMLEKVKDGDLTIKLISSIPPKGRKVKVRHNLKQAEGDNRVKALQQKIEAYQRSKIKVEPVVVEKPKAVLIGIRRLDGAVEEYTDVKDFSYKYITNKNKVADAAEFNHKALASGHSRLADFRLMNSRYLFLPDDLPQLRAVGFIHRLSCHKLTVADVTRALTEEAVYYENRRKIKRERDLKQKRNETQL